MEPTFEEVVFLGRGDVKALRRLEDMLQEQGISTGRYDSYERLAEGIAEKERKAPRLVIIESAEQFEGPKDLKALIKQIKDAHSADVLVVGERPSAEDMLAVLSAHAADYWSVSRVTRDASGFRRLVERIVEEHRELPEGLGAVYASKAGRFLGRSEAILRAVSEAAEAMKSDTVLFQGETGAGKSYLAGTVVQRLGQKRWKNFVRVDCGALAESLFEAQLFGWPRHAFTGADRERPGLFDVANGGVLFLDEIANLALRQQQALLMALESDPEDPFKRTFRRIGYGEQARSVNVQVIAATQFDLRTRVKEGGFSEALYFRVARTCVHVPPLRDRDDDIPFLARQLMLAASNRMGKKFIRIHADVLGALRSYPWPGNVRELSNAISAAVQMNRGVELRLEHLPGRISGLATAGGTAVYGQRLVHLMKMHSVKNLGDISDGFYRGEARLPDGSLARVADLGPDDLENRSSLARRIGIGRRTLGERIRNLPS